MDAELDTATSGILGPTAIVGKTHEVVVAPTREWNPAVAVPATWISGHRSGFGNMTIGSKSMSSPWYSGSSSANITRSASTDSRIRRKRRDGSVPWFSISSMFQPPPTPMATRPPERASSDATDLANWMMSRWATSAMPKPSVIVSVRVMALPMDATGSSTS
jgi:hypothetical protein